MSRAQVRLSRKLLLELKAGLLKLHSSKIKIHGNLKSSNCVVNARFVVKLTDFGILDLRERDESIESADTADFYAEIVTKVREGSLPQMRPMIGEDVEDEIRDLLEKTWKWNPKDRISLSDIKSVIQKSVTEKLVARQPVLAEHFSAVTIYFSDIVGFTSLSSESSPMQIVEMLNALYLLFDTKIKAFDIYKVETIGDAYMAVSGAPQRNDNRHAREVARMALTLLDAVKKF
ncbi:hypothetical protein HAZT_HAZT009465, partial [Hyalella azteca]